MGRFRNIDSPLHLLFHPLKHPVQAPRNSHRRPGSMGLRRSCRKYARPILLRRHRLMRSERRSYNTLPRQPQLPHHHDPGGSSVFIPQRPIHQESLPPSVCRHQSYFDFLLDEARQGQPRAPVRRPGVYRELHDTHALPRGPPARHSNFTLRRSPHYPIVGFNRSQTGRSLRNLPRSADASITSNPWAPFLGPPPPPPHMPGVHALHDTILVASKNPPPADPYVQPTAPCPQLLARLDADQRTSFLNLWDRLPAHLGDVIFDLHNSGRWTA